MKVGHNCSAFKITQKQYFGRIPMKKTIIEKDVIIRAKSMDEDALKEIFLKFRPVIKEMSVKYFLAGADREDVIQEAMIALFGAIKSYDVDKNDNFYPFARKCINLKMKTAVKNSLRKKHSPLNTSVSIDEQPELEAFNLYPDPEEEYINNENYVLINEKLKNILSPLELTVVSLLNMGMKTSEIADILKKNQKSINNTLQRIRKKVQDL